MSGVMTAIVDGFGLSGIGHVEERLHRDVRRILADRRHAEVLVVIELGVVRESEQAHQHHVVLHGDRQRRGDDRRRIAAVDQVDLIDVEQLGVDRGHIGRIALVVVIDKLDRPAEQAALGVLVLRPDLHGEQRGFAAARERARLRHAESDLDRIGRKGRRNRKRGRQDRDRIAANSAQNASLLSHDVLPFGWRPRRRTSIAHVLSGRGYAGDDGRDLPRAACRGTGPSVRTAPERPARRVRR